MATKAEKKETVNSNGVPLFKSDVTKLDEKIDNEIVYEFGGPIGVCAMMIGFPLLMIYFWESLEFHQGRLFYPEAFTVEAFKNFFWNEFYAKFVEAGLPTVKAVKIYMGYVLLSFVLAYIMPGPTVEGLPIPSLKGKRVSWIYISRRDPSRGGNSRRNRIYLVEVPVQRFVVLVPHPCTLCRPSCHWYLPSLRDHRQFWPYHDCKFWMWVGMALRANGTHLASRSPLSGASP